MDIIEYMYVVCTVGDTVMPFGWILFDSLSDNLIVKVTVAAHVTSRATISAQSS